MSLTALLEDFFLPPCSDGLGPALSFYEHRENTICSLSALLLNVMSLNSTSSFCSCIASSARYRQVPLTLSPNVILNCTRIQSQVALHHLQSLKLWLSGLHILTTVLFYSPISHFTHFSLCFLPNLLHTPADQSLFL